MDTNEVILLKKELEAELLEKIKVFELKTGTKVSDIEPVTDREIHEDVERIVSLTVRVRL